jgi:CRISPR system Cascade subunit CasE
MTTAHGSSSLHMLRLLPDMAALARWAAATGQRALREDTGYALHAALRATLGELAPRPFALLERPNSLQLIGYTPQPVAELLQAMALAAVSDPAAAAALGVLEAQNPLIKPMPENWHAGQRLSFEARVAPVVRSRQAQGGGYPEVDAAFHPDFCGDQPGNRDAAHARWLARELARGGAATLLSHRATAFGLAPIARRSARAGNSNVSNDPARRGMSLGLLPDLTVRGQLRVDDAMAFHALLARGLGRHRSFGFGCLLLAPPGAWT